MRNKPRRKVERVSEVVLDDIIGCIDVTFLFSRWVNSGTQGLNEGKKVVVRTAFCPLPGLYVNAPEKSASLIRVHTPFKRIGGGELQRKLRIVKALKR
jgi:hypothetical protein